MIDLTPIDIRSKQGDFPRALRGYQPEQVDDFLALAADRLEEVTLELMRMQERLEHQANELKGHREREHALTSALVSAQELREEVLRQAAREADLIRKEGRLEVDQLRAAALQGVEEEQQIARQLRARREQMVRSFRSFLERELAELTVMEQSAGHVEPSWSVPEPPRPLDWTMAADEGES